MRIAFFLDVFPSLSETFVLNQMTGMIDRGHEVRIFAAMRGDMERRHKEVDDHGLMDKVSFFEDKPSSLTARLLYAPKRASCFDGPSKRVLLKALDVSRYGGHALSLNLFYKAAAVLDHGGFDILQCHFAAPSMLVSMLKEMGVSGKLVSMFHGYGLRRGEESRGAIYERLISNCDIFLSISEYNRRILAGFGVPDRKIVYHPVGIDTERFYDKRESPEKTVVILTVARLIPLKGLSIAVKAIALLAEQLKDIDIKYRIIGEGPDRPQLERLISYHRLADKVELAGARLSGEVAGELARADIFLLPSLEEALPVSVMEAAAASLPVVASRVGSMEELVDDGVTGYLFDPGDKASMAERLKSVIIDPEKRKSMGNNGKDRVKGRYDIHMLNDKLEALYRGLIERKTT